MSGVVLTDEFFMDKALAYAHKAYVRDEVPVGAVVVDGSGQVIGRAHNLVETQKSQTAHAEMLALARAGKKRGDWRLDGCCLYVTLEPCAQCYHLIRLSRVSKIIYGARSPLFGYHLDKLTSLSIYKNNHVPIEVRQGVRERQAAELLQRFFKNKRKSSS